jgi:hypothetical protein
MSRFYFDVREGSRFAPDDEGFDYPDLDAAERMAAETAASIGRDLLPKGDVQDVTIEVRDEHKQRVLTVRLTMERTRVNPKPLRPAGL